jgi:hypothetical protein
VSSQPKRKKGCVAGCALVIITLVLLAGLSLGAVLGFLPLPAQGIVLGGGNGFQLDISNNAGGHSYL